MSFMRKSKFRHVFAKPLKKDQCYDAIRISRSSWDSKFCAVNPKFIAIITESGGGSSFVVLPLAKVGRLDINAPLVFAHKGPVYDIAWSPHNDNLIASCSDDCSVKIWQIPDKGLEESMTEPLVELSHHQRRVTSLIWHPSAENVLFTAGSDNIIIQWNLDSGENVRVIEVPDQVFSMSFNEDGSQLACTCRDKKLRIIDVHTSKTLMETLAHEGTKPPQCAFLKNNKVMTTGFSKMSERQYALWDISKGSLEEMGKEDVDSSNGVMFIFYDPDSSMIYLCGKGDSQIRYYEVTEEAPYVHFLSLYATSNPQKGVCFMPKRGLNANQNEIARMYKLHNNGLCEVTPFTVPRKSELFQEDLYPDTASIEPAITADEFFEGKNAVPKTISFKGGQSTTAVKREGGGIRKTNNVSSVISNRESAAKNNSANDAAEATPSLPPTKGSASESKMSELKKEIEELKKLVSQQDKKIESLEGRVSQLEQSNHTDEEDAGEVA